MVEIVLGVAVFVLAAAVVGLFAMMGELASRLPDEDRPAGPDGPGTGAGDRRAERRLWPVPEARLGAEPAEWPAELAAVREAELAHVVVFGSTCVTCGQIANGETGSLDVLPPPLALVVACPGPEDGAEFLAKHPMVAGYPHVIDVGGTWLASNFEVGISPSVLVFARGRLESAHTFIAATALSHLSTPGSHEGIPVHAVKATS
jgi:hypothetical protein